MVVVELVNAKIMLIYMCTLHLDVILPRHLSEGETGGNCNIFHIFVHYVEHVFY